MGIEPTRIWSDELAIRLPYLTATSSKSVLLDKSLALPEYLSLRGKPWKDLFWKKSSNRWGRISYILFLGAHQRWWDSNPLLYQIATNFKLAPFQSAHLFKKKIFYICWLLTGILPQVPTTGIGGLGAAINILTENTYRRYL